MASVLGRQGWAVRTQYRQLTGLKKASAGEEATAAAMCACTGGKAASAVYGQQPRRHYDYGNAMDEGGPRIRGIEILRDPHLNKGTAFSLKERQILGVHGLLPPTVFTQDQQAERIMANIRHWDNDLDKYVYLTGLQDRNEQLFYRIVSDNIEELAPIIYTPTVGLACLRYGFIFRKPRGLYITINDKGHSKDILCNWPEKDVKVVCMTDGERILGLGDLGAFGMGIPVGKLSLYTAMGGVPPQKCLPIVLDVGTDNEKLLDDPMYIGLRHKRVRGQQYYDLVDEVIHAIVKRFGNDTLIQFEDFANVHAFKLLEKYRNKFLVFNDDIQGTASVVVAGLMAAMRTLSDKLENHKFLFLGAGEAATGIASLLARAMVEEGSTQEDANSRIWMIDIDGLLTKGRPKGEIGSHQEPFAKDFKHMNNLEDICKEIRPTVAIGAAAAPGAFTETFLKDMAEFNERPIIFALSNPTSKAECTAEEAYTHTDGRCLFASGSPFAPVTYKGQTFYPGQGNNAYIFPGVGLGSIVSGARHITEGFFLAASRSLAAQVTEENFAEGRLYPPLTKIREVSWKIATDTVEYSYRRGMAATYPEPEDKAAFVRQHMYKLEYDDFMPVTYGWPGMPE